MAPIIKQAENPTHVIGNGCAKPIGSWYAVETFSKAIEPYPRRMKYEYIPSNNRFTFANGQTSKVDSTLRLFSDTSPPMMTFIGVLEQGQAPALLSIDQTRNLHMTIEYTPQYDKITCKAFGMIRQPIPDSSSGHAMIDLATFCKQHDARTAIRPPMTTSFGLPSPLAAAHPAEAASKAPIVPAPAPAAETTETIGQVNNGHWIINHTTCVYEESAVRT